MTGHARNAIVEDDANRIGPIIRHFHERINARMEERRVPHDGYNPFILTALCKAVA